MDTTQGNELNPSTGAESTTSTTTPVEASSQGATTQESQTPAYTPNYKFKVMDKEHEIPESFRTLIKDADSEKQVREVYEKAYGLDHVKADRDAIRNQFKDFRTQNEPVINTYNSAATAYNRAMDAWEKGNMKAAMVNLQDAFGALKVPDKVLKQYVYNLLNMEELPPEQRNEYNNYRELERQSYTQQQQLEQYQSQLHQLAVQTRTSELQNALSKPEVASVVQAYDQRKGQSGAFRDRVIQLGQYYASPAGGGRDVSAEEIVKELISDYGPIVPTQQAQVPAAQTQAQTPPPVIPTVKGGSGGPSAVVKKAKSVADLKKLAQQYTD